MNDLVVMNYEEINEAKVLGFTNLSEPYIHFTYKNKKGTYYLKSSEEYVVTLGKKVYYKDHLREGSSFTAFDKKFIKAFHEIFSHIINIKNNCNDFSLNLEEA